MEAEQNIRRNWRSRGGRIVFSTALIVCLCGMMSGCRKQRTSEPAASSNAASTAEDAAIRDLRAIGTKAANAVLARDIDPLLAYDHNPEDEGSLKSKSGDAYCYLFDSSCISGPPARSVYEILSTARQLGIEASVAKVPERGKIYGLLMFYDKSQVSDRELYSPDFLCSDKGKRTTASWHFVSSNGQWNTSTLFDYKTDKPCK